MYTYIILFYRYFPFLPSYWFDWLPYFSNQTKQLQVRVRTPDIQDNDDDDDTISEGSGLLQTNKVCEILKWPGDTTVFGEFKGTPLALQLLSFNSEITHPLGGKGGCVFELQADVDKNDLR